MTTSEPVARTLLIATAVALACSAMVATAVNWLRPVQVAHQQVERNSAIVKVAGLAADLGSAESVTNAYFQLDARVWDRQTGAFANLYDGRSYDHWSAEQGDELPRFVPIYLVPSGDTRVVLPVHGKGMWSTIYGYIGLGSDLNTITELYFHRHGETPGIGDRIQRTTWLDTWRGKRVYGPEGTVRLRVSSREPRNPRHQVDLIAGASVTSEKVGEFVAEWMGSAGYAPLLSTLRGEIGPTREEQLE